MFISAIRVSSVTRITFSVMSFTTARRVRITAVPVTTRWDTTPAMRAGTGNAKRDGRETTAPIVSSLQPMCVSDGQRSVKSFGIVCLGPKEVVLSLS